ncbi:MAG TPA: type II toxin-antitoxin system RelE/ParE family toxin [Candidatus Saccharimonadales bacterium]|nr:type II toxin-antitoxin system RelE/ParE family toxin [Candidatus Saccharimonadales bacterium]
MSYRLKIEGRAKKDLQALDTVTQRRIAKKLKFFLDQPDPLEHAKKLVDAAAGTYRWRIGPYRIIFDAEGKTIRLLRVQHRREVYRRR